MTSLQRKQLDLLSRRQALLRLAGSVTAATLGPSLFSALAVPAPDRPRKHLIFLWLDGGPSQLETFDPKPDSSTAGSAGAIPTDVSGWTFSEYLPGLARRARKLCVIRSMTSKEGNHSRARVLVKTGYPQTPTVPFPSLGSIASAELGEPEAELPGFIQVGGAPSEAGYLGIEHAPLVISDPEREIDNIDYAKGVRDTRMDYRQNLLRVLEDSYAQRGGDLAVASNRSLRKKARRLMDSKLRSAFDLNEEKERTRDRYGRNSFGQGCLLARRLVEAGVSAVEVELGGWDTHSDNHRRTRDLCEKLDPGLSTLLDELETRRLLDDTVIVCMGEFGRTPEISGSDGRNHWPHNWCVALAGGGLRTGGALGATDEDGRTIGERPVTVPDLYATLARALGIDRDRETTVNQRPVRLVDAEGEEIRELL